MHSGRIIQKTRQCHKMSCGFTRQTGTAAGSSRTIRSVHLLPLRESYKVTGIRELGLFNIGNCCKNDTDLGLKWELRLPSGMEPETVATASEPGETNAAPVAIPRFSVVERWLPTDEHAGVTRQMFARRIRADENASLSLGS